MNNDAQYAYLTEGDAKQARKRVAADVLIRDQAGHILLVNPAYKDFWDLPGGMAEENEPPRLAAERELQEELGATITVGRLLVLDWDGPRGPWSDQLVFVFDGGILTTDQITTLRTVDGELKDFGFFAGHEACTRLRDDMAHRLQRAIRASTVGATDYNESHPHQRA